MCKYKRGYRLLSTDLNKIETKTEGGDEVCIVLLNNSSIGQFLLPHVKLGIRQKGIVFIFEGEKLKTHFRHGNNLKKRGTKAYLQVL